MTFVGNRKCYTRTGKLKKNYVDQKRAEQAVKRQTQKNLLPSWQRYVAYACGDCGGWHIGSVSIEA